MASISLGGVNLDVNGLVSQLMAVESAPLQKLQKEKADYKSQLSELGRLKSALEKYQSSMESLSSLDKFEAYKASTNEASDNQSFTVTTDKNASAGTYSIEVTQLAQVGKHGSHTGIASQTSDFTSAENLQLSVNGKALSVDINNKNLTEVRDSINAAAKADGVNVSASIVKENDSSYRLVLTGTETGAANAINVTNNAASTALHLNTDGGGDSPVLQDAKDAIVKVDNSFDVSSSTNTISGAIEGVTINLLKQSPSAATLDVTRDTAAVKESINNFVKEYNSLRSSINVYKTGALKGDSTLNTIQNQMRGVLNTSAGVDTQYNYLSEVGIRTNAKTGELEVDSETLDKALSENFEDVSQLFAAKDKGVAYRMDDLVDEFVKFTGLIKSRENGINDRIRSNEDEQDRVAYRLEKKEAAYRKQFSSLDSLIGQMNSTQSALASQLASLPGFG